MVKGEKTEPKRKKKKMASISPCGKVQWEGFGRQPQPHTTNNAASRNSPLASDRSPTYSWYIFPWNQGWSLWQAGRWQFQVTGDPMWRSDQEVIQPTVFYPYRLTFLKDTSSHMIKSRGNPCTPIIMWARQGTNHTDLLCGYTSK